MADAHAYLTMSMVTKESLVVLLNNTEFIKHINTVYRNEFAQTGAKIGQRLQIRKPIPWVVEEGDGFNPRPFVEEYVDLEITKHQHCDMQFGMVEKTLNIENYSKRYIKPRVSELGNAMDYGAMQLTYWQVANSLGGATPNTWDTYSYAKALLDLYATPKADRYVMVSPWENSAIVIDNKALFNSVSQIKDQYESGDMWRTLGANWLMDQNMPVHTTGPRGGAPLVDGAGQTGGVLRVRGFTAAAGLRFKRGDTFALGTSASPAPGDVYGVNPRSRATIGRLQDFTCLQDVYSDASGVALISISPPIILGPDDPRQTVNMSPPDGKQVIPRGTANTAYAQNLFYQRDAFTLATVDFEPPQGGVEWSRAVDPEAGVTVQAAAQFDIRAYSNLSRLDDLWGANTLRPECCVRVWSLANVTVP
jgi:hypothetical protein